MVSGKTNIAGTEKVYIFSTGSIKKRQANPNAICGRARQNALAGQHGKAIYNSQT